MVNEYELKKLIIDIGQRIWQRGFVAANDGNITVKLNDNEILTTPTGVSKGFMTTDMIIKMDMSGNVLSRASKYRPSSEVKMHLEVYRERPDVKSVIHAHPPYCTSFAVAGIPLDKCVLPEAIIVLGAVPITPYGTPSTREIPDSINPYIKQSDSILLANHGALTLGSDLINAYYKMETLEHAAKIIHLSQQLGNVNVLPETEVKKLMNVREQMKVPGKISLCSCSPDNPAQSTEDLVARITKDVMAKLGGN